MERGTSGLEKTINHFSHPHPLELSNFQAKKTLEITQLITCSACKLKPSDWIYSCASCDFFLHAKCSNFPKQIAHPCHKEHALSLLSKPSKGFTCEACGKSGDGFGYNCKYCKCNLHALCALLPLSHSHSAHPCELKLTFDVPNSHVYFQCDICTETSYNQWFYWCSSCDFSVHSGCINRSPVIRKASSQRAATSQSVAKHQPSRSISQPTYPDRQAITSWNQAPQPAPFMAPRPLNAGMMYRPPYPVPQPMYSVPLTTQDHQKMVLQQAIHQLTVTDGVRNRVAIKMLQSMLEGAGNGFGNSAFQSIMQPSGGGLFNIPGFDGFGGLDGLFGGLGLL